MADQQQTATLTVLLNGVAAKAELGELQKQSKDLAKQIDEARKAGNKAFADQLQRDLKVVNQSMKTLRRETVDTTKVLNNLSKATPRELSRTLSALQAQLNSGKIRRGSKEWDYLQNSIMRVRAEMRSISAESVVAESSLTRLSNGFNKYFGMVTTFLASITGMSFAFRKLSEDVAKLDDVYSDVMKTTGMTRDEVVDLNEEFKKMDTRTPREQLNLLARDAGKLGLTSKKDILDFVEAGNQIRVALGEDLGEDAIKNIGKMVDVYKRSSDTLKGLDLKEQMLAAGSAVNQLGASSTASEPYLVTFAGRLGGVAKQANISMDAILGFASALDQDMQAVEMSATALQNFIMKMMGDPAKFAKLAGLEVKGFTELLKTDANEAIKQVLRSLNAKGSFQDLIPILEDMGLSGARAVGVLSAMAGSIDKIDEAQRIANQAMTEGVSVTDEYNIKNNNLMARLEKAKKEFNEKALILGEKLNPVLLRSVNLTTMFVKAISAMSDWLSKYGGVIVKTTAAIALYTVAVNASIIADKLKVFWTDKIIASLRRLWIVMLNNPWGVLIAAGTALLALYQTLNKELTIAEQKQKALDDASKAAQKNIARETAMLEQLLKVARDENRSQEERLKAIKKLNEISPEHLGNLTLEEINTNKAKVAINNYRDSLLDAAMAKAAFDKIVELQQKKLDLQNKSATDIYDDNSNFEHKLGAGLANMFGDIDYVRYDIDRALNKHQASMDAIDAQIEALTQRPELKKSIIDDDDSSGTIEGPKTPEGNDNAIRDKIREYDRLAAIRRIAAMQAYKDQESYEKQLLEIEIEAIKRKQALYKQDSAEYIQYQEQLQRFSLKESQDKIKTTEEREKAIAELIKKYHTKTDEELKQDELAALNELFDEKLRETEEYLKIRQAIYDKYDPERKANIEAAKQLVADNPNQTNKKKDLKDLDLQELERAERAELAALSALESLHDAEINAIVNFEELRLSIESKYADLRIAQNEKEWQEKLSHIQGGLEHINTLLSAATGYFQASQQAEAAAVEAKYDKQIKAAGKNNSKIEKLEAAKEKELSKIRAEAGEKTFALQAAQAFAGTALAAIHAYSAGLQVGGPAGLVAGPIAMGVAIAAGMLQLATIKKQAEAAKAGYASGGFTPSGPWNKPQGVVHSDEFIGNRFAVANPAVRKVFNIVDEAQRNNTVSALTEKDFSRALDYREAENRHFVSGVSAAIGAGSSNENENFILESLTAWLNRNAEVTDKLNSRLGEPFVGEVSITGRRGINENMDLYDRMINNASR